MRAVTAGTDTLFIVNDDPEIASAVGADGVHVGQGDMPPNEVRRRYPDLRIVGLSTHNPAQVLAAESEVVDYIGVGPVFPTPTKEIPDPVLGLDMMREMISHSSRPAVAIGGIDAGSVTQVIAAGARNYAVVRAVCKAADPYTALLSLLRRARYFNAKGQNLV